MTAAAAVASSGADGDHLKSVPRINVGGIVNAATSVPAPNNSVCPGAIISIYGTGLANNTHQVLPSDVINGFLPLSLDGVTVLFGPEAAALFYISPLQINAQAPVDLQPGAWNVTVVVNNLSSTFPVQVSHYSPGLFLPARHVDGTAVSGSAPAQPGEWILFYGTGFGATRSPTLLTGQFAPRMPIPLAAPFTAQIGDVTLPPEDVYYGGAAPDYAGLYQFNLRLPAAAPAGNTDVSIAIGGASTQPGFQIAVGPPSASMQRLSR